MSRSKQQYSFLLFKPDAMRKELTPTVLEMITRRGFKIVYFQSILLDPGRLSMHYKHLPEHLLRRVISWMQWSKAHSAVIEGDINELRNLVGATDPSQAGGLTIRGVFSSDSIRLADREKRALENVVHCSADPESANAEIRLWMPHRQNDFKNDLTSTKPRGKVTQ